MNTQNQQCVRNMDRIVNLRVYVNNAEKMHSASKHNVNKLSFLLRVSVDYHNLKKEKQCAEHLDKADKIIRKII